MKVKRCVKTLATLMATCAVMAFSGGAQAAPSTYNVTQSFGSNGTLTASFTGEETSFDGVLADTEILSLTMTFTGPSYTGTFTNVNASGFAWVIGDTNLEDINTAISVSALQSGGQGFSWTAGGLYFLPGDSILGSVQVMGQNGPVGGAFTTDTAATVTSAAAVPEPETYALMLAGLGVVGAIGRRQKRLR